MHAVARIWGRFRLRQHGTSHPLCAVFYALCRKTAHNKKSRFEQPRQRTTTALDTRAHWELGNPLNIIPALILLATLASIGALIVSLI